MNHLQNVWDIIETTIPTKFQNYQTENVACGV